MVRAEVSSFGGVRINYPHDECSFNYSPIDFCDQKHVDAYNLALQAEPVNFNRHYVLLPIKEWSDGDENSIVAIDKDTGVVYPVPIDTFFASSASKKGKKDRAKLIYSKDGNSLCIIGSISVYRSSQTGKFCFQFEGDRFTGYHTTYMGHDRP